MMALATHLQHNEADKQKLKSQVKRLCQENAWLRDELNSVQQQHQMLGQQVAQLEEENKHLEFMISIKKFDEDQQETSRDVAVEQKPENHSQTLQELGFGPEDEDEMQASNFGVSQPTPPNVMAASASGGYEIPHRLKTLHNLVSITTLNVCKHNCITFYTFFNFRLFNTRIKGGMKLPFLFVNKLWKIWNGTVGTIILMWLPCLTFWL